jgi:prepilin-type N-terminal cleavage/methylation domain-containing protein
MFKLKNKKGVSLIELIVVIGIIGIMAAVSIVSLTKARNETAVEGEADKLVAVIREAQNYALTGKSADSECYRYRVSVSTSGKYSLENIKQSGEGCSLEYDYLLDNGVSCVSISSVVFNAPHADVSSTGVIFSLIRGGYTCRVSINSVGLITKNCSY